MTIFSSIGSKKDLLEKICSNTDNQNTELIRKHTKKFVEDTYYKLKNTVMSKAETYEFMTKFFKVIEVYEKDIAKACADMFNEYTENGDVARNVKKVCKFILDSYNAVINFFKEFFGYLDSSLVDKIVNFAKNLLEGLRSHLDSKFRQQNNREELFGMF